MDRDPQGIRVKTSPTRFFVLTFILSWIIFIPLALSRWGIVQLNVPPGSGVMIAFPGVLMPAVAALLLSWRAGELRALMGRLTLWRVGWQWWMVALLGQPVLLLLAALAYRLLFGEFPVQLQQQGANGSLIVTILFLLLATLGEEIGWRGLALPALQMRYNAFIASAILGLIYIAWHTPYWLLTGSPTREGLFYIGLNYLFAFPLTFYATWFINGGRFSLLLVVGFHLVFNIVNTAIFPLTTNITAYGILIVFEWIIAILLIPRLRRITPKGQP